MSSTINTAGVREYSSDAENDDNALIENGYITVQGATGVLPRYNNVHLTVIDSKVKINAPANSVIDIHSSLYTTLKNVEINDAQNTTVNVDKNIDQIVVNKGSNNNYNTFYGMSLSNASGNNTITAAYGGVSIYGSTDPSVDDLHLTLNAGTGNTLIRRSTFSAGAGNATLDGSASKANINVSAGNYTSKDLVASTGSGDDNFAGGNGNATFSGGAGDNLFSFFQYQLTDSNTVITDFNRSSGNKLYFNGFKTDIQTIIKNAYDSYKVDDNNQTHVYTNIDLGSTKVQLQDISSSELSVRNFSIDGNR